MAVPTIVDYSVITHIYQNTLTADYTGLTVNSGDLILILAYCDYERVMMIDDASFTKLFGTSRPTKVTHYAWYKVATGSESAPTVTLDAGAEPMKIVAITINGWNTSLNIRTNTYTDVGTTLVAPDDTATTDALVIRSCVHRNTNYTFTTPATEIEKGNSGQVSNTHIYAGESSESFTSVGSVGTANFLATGSVAYLAATFVIRGSGGTVTASISDYENPWYSEAEGAINGLNFEAAQGSGTVTLEQDAQTAAMTISSWSDDEIIAVAPAMLGTSLRSSDETLLRVSPDSNADGTKILTLEYSNNHRYVDIGTLAADTGTRIEAGSLATDWQLIYSKYLYDSTGTTLLTDYLVEIREDGTFTIAGQPPDGTYKLPIVEYNDSTNTWGSFVSQTIVVDTQVDQPAGDTTAPVITTPPAGDLTINISATATGVFHTNTVLVNWLATASAVDAVDGTVAVTNNISTLINPLPVGTTTITFSAEDAAGNSSSDTADVIVTQDETDTVAPVVTAPDDLTIVFPFGAQGIPQSHSTLTAWLGSVTAFDEIDGNISGDVTNNITSLLNPIPPGIYPISFTVDDTAGNTGSDTANLTIEEGDQPSVPPEVQTGFMSGSTDYVVSCSNLIADAYRHIGALAEGETLSDYRKTFALRQLNLMIKAWSVRGYRLWTLYQASLTLVAGTQSYSIGAGGDLNIARPLKVLFAQYKNSSGLEVPVEIAGRERYYNQTNKATSGTPSMVYYDPRFTGSATAPKGRMFVWPVLATGATGTLEFCYSQYIQDLDSCPGDDVPLPVEWAEALAWNLAVRIAPSENISPIEIAALQDTARDMLAEAEMNDTDSSSTISMRCD